jgi:uncharacterized membrane protein YkoI
MKKNILAALALCLFSAHLLYAQTTTNQSKTTQAKTTQTNVVPGKTPDAVLNGFKTKYPNIKANKWEWKVDKKAYEADFSMGGKNMEALFSPDGKWMKTKYDISMNQLPAAVSKALASSEYSTWTMGDFAEVETPEKGKLYKVEVKKGTQKYDLKYDAAGKLVDKKADKPKNSTQKN